MKRYILAFAVSLPLFVSSKTQLISEKKEQSESSKQNHHHQFLTVWQSIINAFKAYY